MSDTKPVAVIVNNVSKNFKLPHEKVTSIKSLVVNFYKKRSFENQRVLKNISLEINEGDFIGIVGRNGSGKSTLLKLLAGIYTPTEGAIQVNGKLTPFIELGVGFNQELTGRENVFLSGSLLGFSRKEMAAMYDDIVAFAELGKFMDQKLKNYSSGMQVRLAFSIAIRAKSDILLLDEVLAVGDAAFQQKCYNYFEELKRENKTVIFVSHDMGAVRRFCDRAVFIDKGKIVHVGTPPEVADMYTVENIERAQKNDTNDESKKSVYSVSSKIIKQTDQNVSVKISYESARKDEMYIGISVMKDGVSIAEINTLSEKPLTGSGTITYDLDTTILNNGIYQVDAALLGLSNKELLSFTVKKARFVVRGNDPTRGGSLRLKATWNGKNDG